MQPFVHSSKRPSSTWMAAGIVLIIAGLAMIPVNVVTPVGIGFIVGGLCVIGAAFCKGVRQHPPRG